jgi:hypothetical protein
MKTLTLLTLLAITGCGTLLDLNDRFHRGVASDHRNTTDSTFQEYLDELGLTTDSVIIFKKQKDGIAGSCTTWSDGYKEVQIDPDYWNSYWTTRAEQLELIAHELGHCDLGLGHTTAKRSDGCAESVMYPSNFGNPCFDKHKSDYLSIFK